MHTKILVEFCIFLQWDLAEDDNTNLFMLDHVKVGSVTKKKKSSIFVRANLCLKQFISEYLRLVVYAKVIAIYILVIKLCTLT